MSKIVITAANSQIGSFLAKEYLKEGKELVLLYHNNTQRIKGLQAERYQVDLSDLAAVKAVFDKIEGEIDAVIHCAAIRSEDAMPLSDTDEAVFARVFNGNFYPAYNVLRAVLPRMKSRGFGRIVLFGSEVSKDGLINGSAYAASKAAIANLAKSASRENAKHNVLINCISPGPVFTNLEEDYEGEYLIFRKKYFDDHRLKCASGELITMQEIKLLADIMMSKELRNMCGEEIFLTGGKL